MSQFLFLQAEWPAVADAASRAEQAAHADPRTTCFYARRALELAVAWAFKHDAALKLPYQDNVSALIHEPSFKQAAGEAVFSKAKVIVTLGNRAVHGHRAVPASDALAALRELFHVGYWLARTYGRVARPAPGLAFDASALPKGPPAPKQDAEKLQRLEASLHERDEKLAVLLADKSALDDELKRLRAEVAAAKKAAAAQPDTHDYSEAETRDYFIDLLLKEAGWPLDQPRDREWKSAACRTTRARASSITCCGATTASRSAWSKPSARAAMPGSATSRPSCTPTAWRSSSGSGRSSSIPTATSTGSGTTRTTRRGQCRASTRRPSWSWRSSAAARASRWRRPRSTGSSSSASIRRAPSAASPRRSSATTTARRSS